MEERQYDKERCFVRGIGSKGYSLQQELERVRSLPRVIKGYGLQWGGGPVGFGKNLINPGSGAIQSLHCSLDQMVPGGRSEKHGHQNPALLFVLEGQGYDIHDGVRYDWSAGDLLIVKAGCVHQHFNASTDRPSQVLIIKAKPLYIFLGLIFQGFVKKAPKDPIPGWENFKPVNGSFLKET